MASYLHVIEDRSHIGSARRATHELAVSLGFDTEAAGTAALAVTEACSNILKHAGRGRLVLRALMRGDTGGLEILALDRGPGMANVAASLRDGHSTSGTLGTGLGALARASDSFEVFSQPGNGTALRLELWAGTPPSEDSLAVGALCIAKSGEMVPGDDWAVVAGDGRATVLLADGLGHGADAARAARTATAVLAARPTAEPTVLIEDCHGALKATRGAAVAVARIVPGEQRGSFAGVGNIVARVEGSTGARNLVSHHGTAGHNLRRLQEFAFAFPQSALLVLHSDGLATRWDLADYPGLSLKHPGLIAGVLYRDHDRGRDDVTVVVIRNGAPD